MVTHSAPLPSGANPAAPSEPSLARLQRREPEAWSTLYDRHFLLLYRYAYARLRLREEAEDLAAQVFLEALRGIDSYEDRGRPMLAWLYRIAHNLVVERHRRDERARRAAEIGHGAVHAPGPEASVDHLDLLEALGHLTAGQREVIILRFLLQMSIREVASLVSRTEPGVVSLQNRGIAALKRRLGTQVPQRPGTLPNVCT